VRLTARARPAVAFGHAQPPSAEHAERGAVGRWVCREMDTLMRRLLHELQSESTWMDVEDLAASHGDDQVRAVPTGTLDSEKRVCLSALCCEVPHARYPTCRRRCGRSWRC
jgi:hypothetical protein